MCRHNNASLTIHEAVLTDDLFDLGPVEFALWQCDDCGMILRCGVTEEDVNSQPLVKFDEEAYSLAYRATNGNVRFGPFLPTITGVGHCTAAG